MNIQTIQKIYPQAVLQPISTEDPNYLVFSNNRQFLWLPTAGLSKTEIQLLQSFIAPAPLVKHFGAGILLGSTLVPEIVSSWSS